MMKSPSNGNVPMRGGSKLRVLFLPLEASHWFIARSTPYPAFLGFEEGFEASGVEFLTLPAIWQGLGERVAWLNRVKEICAGKQFDQVWVEMIHTEWDDELLEWLAGVAPVRVAILLESLRYSPEEYEQSIMIREYLPRVEKGLNYITHVVTVDEEDVREINERRLARAMWSPAAIPQRYVVERESMPPRDYAVFIGNPYCGRANWLEKSELKGLLRHVISKENETLYPRMFDWINRFAKYYAKTHLPATAASALHVAMLRHVRLKCFDYYLETLQRGCAVVNLPHWVKTYSFRILEAMAIGRPAISWEIPNRPLNKAIYEEGKEILLFNADDPAQLAEHIRRVIAEPDFAKRLTANARRKVRHLHTTEKRVEQILNWIEKGEAPSYA